jgi:hypothetical protein
MNETLPTIGDCLHKGRIHFYIFTCSKRCWMNNSNKPVAFKFPANTKSIIIRCPSCKIGSLETRDTETWVGIVKDYPKNLYTTKED